MDVNGTERRLREFFAKVQHGMSYRQFEGRMIDLMQDARDLGVRLEREDAKKKLDGMAKQAYEEGLREGEAEGSWWTDEQIYDLLRSERIGEERARRIVDKLCEGLE